MTTRDQQLSFISHYIIASTPSVKMLPITDEFGWGMVISGEVSELRALHQIFSQLKFNCDRRGVTFCSAGKKYSFTVYLTKGEIYDLFILLAIREEEGQER